MSAYEKKIAAEAAVDYIHDGMTVGLGTGSTVEFAVRKLGGMVRNGLSVQCIPTSEATARQAREEGISLIDFSQTTVIDLTIDGADEIDADLNMIKGGGGALLREKVVASVSKEIITIADSSKNVAYLGAFPLPVEVIPFGWEVVAQKLGALNVDIVLRKKDGSPDVTDNGNYILDCHIKRIKDAGALEAQINSIPGVMVNGLFVDLATRLIFAQGNQIVIKDKRRV